MCERVDRRIFCNECGYPRSEARYGDDAALSPIPTKVEYIHQMWGESIEGKYVKTNWIDLQTRLETLLATCAKDFA